MGKSKADFLNMLKSATKEPKGVFLGDATTNRDAAHNKSYDGIYLCYYGTFERSLLAHAIHEDKEKVTKLLDKYTKWFQEFNPTPHAKERR